MAEYVCIAACIAWILASLRQWRFRGVAKPEFWWAFCVVLFGGAGAFWSIQSADQASQVFSILRVAPPTITGVFLAAHAVRRGGTISLVGGALIATILPMIAISVGTLDVGMIALAVAIVLPAIVSPTAGYSREGFLSGVTAGTSAMLVLIALQVLLQPSIYIGPCRGDKCSVWGEALGPLGLGNAIGVCLAVIAPLSMIISSGAVRTAVTLLAGATLVDLTSSRSAMIAFAVAAVIACTYRVAVWHALRGRKPEIRSRRWREARLTMSAGVLGVAVVVAAVPLWRWRPGAFTGRADLWSYALGHVIPESLFFGHGSSYWVRQAATVQLQANYATHNLLTEILVSAGLWGAVWLTIGVFASTKVGRDTRLNLVGIAAVGIWLSSCITEVSSAPGRLYLMAALFPLVIALAQSRDRVADSFAGEMPEMPMSGKVIQR